MTCSVEEENCGTNFYCSEGIGFGCVQMTCMSSEAAITDTCQSNLCVNYFCTECSLNKECPSADGTSYGCYDGLCVAEETLSAGAIVGIIIAVLVGVVLIVVIILKCCRSSENALDRNTSAVAYGVNETPEDHETPTSAGLLQKEEF